MRFLLTLCLAAFCCTGMNFAQNSESYFTLRPTLTPNADAIIFSMEGDLWKVPTDGGIATRITAMDGMEMQPRISPDGKWVAFSSNQYGNSDVYIMPLEGGPITQLTFHDGTDGVTSWSWDSKSVYFTSNRYNRTSTYKVSIKGGTPERIFDHYFNTVHNAVEHPNGDEIYFNETWESDFFAHRKRYKGDYNPDIKSYNFKTKEFKKHTTYRGKDFGLSFDRNGKGYFKSDEANGEYNLYTFENGTKKQLTSFDTSIMWPQVSADGSKIVFRRDYQIHVYDVASGKTTKPKIQTFKNNTLNKEQSFNTGGKVSYFDVSPDEKKLAFISRGRLFISDIKGKYIQELATDSKEAISEVKWLKDNASLVFAQSYKGYYNWYSIDVKTGKIKQHTKDAMNNRQISLNSDRSKAVYLKGRNQVCLMDLSSFNSEVIVEDELWGFYNATPSFSPDDKYIAFNVKKNFEDEVMVYNTTNKVVTNLTNTKVSESNPTWSPDGKYLYFDSDRTQPGYPFGTSNSKIYQMALDKFGKPFKSDKVAELFKEEEKDKKDDKEKKDKDEKKVSVTINPKNIMERITRISPSFGQQFGPEVFQKDEKTMVLYFSNHAEGRNHLWKTTITPFEENKTEKVSEKPVRGGQLVKAKKGNYMLLNGTINTLDISGGKLKAIATKTDFNKSLSNEFTQMYYEAWAGMEENFYNETFHGENWQELRDQYAKYLPYVTERSQLRLIFNEMLGELNTSHFGFNSNGREESIYYGSRTLATGIEFNNENPYLVERIITDSPADIRDITLRKGDKLIAVNGQKVDAKTNREFYFNVPKSTDEMSMEFERNGSAFTVKLHPARSFSISTLLYDEWQDANQAYVDSKTNNSVAYVHMKNMGGGELQKFKEDLVTAESDKKALILDLRYNTGGNVHDEVLKFLSQRSYLQWKYREGKKTNQSNFGYSDKPIVLLINEQSLSDAEMTAAGFKELGLGTIVGTETYRWIIFTSGKGLVDGSFYRLPSWGCYTLDGKNLELEGVAPDVYTPKDFKDRLENNHPQLDKAIELIMKELK